MKVTIDLRGLNALFRKAPEVFLSEMSRGAKKGLVAIQRDARRTHRFKRKSGNLSRSVTVDFKSFKSPGRGIYLDSGLAPYAAAIHDGSRPHKIYPKGNALVFIKGGRRIVVLKSGWKSPNAVPGWMIRSGLIGGDMAKKTGGTTWSRKGYVDHPGTKPDPFLYQAADRGVKNLISEISRGIGKAIIKLGIKA